MKVVICGAGQVGFGIAERLSAEDNDVSIVDFSPKLIQQVSEILDVRGIVGHGAHPDVLVQAGIDQADMIIAATLYDEVNMVACQVAHSLFNVPTKIARVREQSYLQPHWRDLFSTDNMPIDVIISPEIEVGEMVLRRLQLPGAFDTVSFADDEAIVAGVTCEENCPIVDTPLHQLTDLFPDLKAVIVGIYRDGQLFVPSSSDQMLVGDIAYFVSARDQVRRTLGIFGHEESEANRVIISGGGNIGLYVAKQLEKRQRTAKIKLIEQDRRRAIDIADQLERSVVLHGSTLDESILLEADAHDTDTLVALTNNDEVNVLSCVIARGFGVEKTLALVNNSAYPDLARSLGISAHVNPRQITISKILQHVRRGRIRGVHSIQNGLAEVIEAEALETSPLVGRPLSELRLSKDMRIGAILRGGELLIPRGNTVVHAHDRVVIFAMQRAVRHVEQMFRVSIEFF